MAHVTRSARAEEDLVQIWLYVARDNPTAADKLLDTVDAACHRLAQNPRMGPARPDLAPDLRYFIVGRYLVLYRALRDGIDVVRVVHGARYLPNLI